jgi:ABC-type antimicrobial peptide transport system permease subunit
VRRDVLWSGLTPVLVGIVAGIVMALTFAQALNRFLYGVSPNDPASFAVAVGALLFAGVIAALVPAARAARTDPMAALRSD